MKELKPCPFCGEAAEIKELTGRFAVECKNKCAATRIFKDINKAVEVWNRRVKE